VFQTRFGAATSAPIPPVDDYGGVFISCVRPCEVARAAYECVILQQEHCLSASLALSSKQIDFYGAEVLD
jgi:hypothetical protein